jgi:hypothetical protein
MVATTSFRPSWPGYRRDAGAFLFYTAKWNNIERWLFSFICMNWRGQAVQSATKSSSTLIATTIPGTRGVRRTRLQNVSGGYQG